MVSDPFGEAVGSLDDATFSLDSNNYTISQLGRFPSPGGGVIGIRLGGELTEDEKRTLVLHVCDTAFPFSVATYSSSTSRQRYEWPGNGSDNPLYRQAERTIYLSRDTRAPSLSTATPPAVDGTSLVLTFDEDLETGSTGIPAGSAFTVEVDDTAVSLSGNPVSVSGKEVTLTLASAVTAGQRVTVAYTKPLLRQLSSRWVRQRGGHHCRSGP